MICSEAGCNAGAVAPDTKLMMEEIIDVAADEPARLESLQKGLGGEVHFL